MAAEVDDQARPERLAGQARPRASGMERDRLLGGVPDQGDEVVLGPRHDDAERVDLVEAGVVRVRGALDRLEQQFAVDHARGGRRESAPVVRPSWQEADRIRKEGGRRPGRRRPGRCLRCSSTRSRSWR